MEQIGVIGGGVSGAGVVHQLVAGIIAKEAEKKTLIKYIIYIWERENDIGGGIEFIYLIYL